jgi:TolB-like protein/DNA-binding winged helix-turn-helix (wHTH) protein/tetratricopeptide (TPR) repeat protein
VKAAVPISSPLTLSDESGRCRFGLFDFEFRTGELRRDGQVVKLSPQPARVLALLLARPGEVVLRDELRSHLWGDDTFVDFERGLNFCILQVRSALGDSSDNPRYVQTVPRKGYRFIAPVARVAPVAPDALVHRTAPSAPDAPSAPVAPASIWRPVAAIGAATLVLVAWLGWSGRSPDGAALPGRIRVAVLPFVNLTGDAGADYLADGLTDELITELGQLSPKRLAVIARTSAMTYRNTPKTVAQIGQELGVSFVVENSVRREAGGLRIGSNLIAARDQTPVAVWSELFGSDEAAPPASQTGAAIRMARLIALEMVDDRPADDAPRSTPSVAAWNHLLRGRALMNRGTPDEVRRAIAELESAVSVDPRFATGWAKLAEARHLLVMMGAAAPTDAYPPAHDAAERALAADSRLADAHLAQGLVRLWYDGEPADAARSFKRALAINDSSAAAHHDYAWSLLALGRADEAIAHITTARDLDPLSARANNDIGWLYLQLGRPADAARACQHTLAIQPRSLEAQACLERAHVGRGMYDAALQAARATLPPSNATLPSVEGMPAKDALQAIWRWRLAELEAASRTRWISAYTLAVQHALLGNRAQALDALEKAAAQRSGMMVFLDRDPALDSLRDDPRFRAIATGIGEARR